MIDDLSPEFLKKYPYPGPPKGREMRIYSLIGTKLKQRQDGSMFLECPNSRTFPKSYEILDGYELKKITFTSHAIDKFNPTVDPNDRVEFLKDDQGKIHITKDNYTTAMQIDKFLFYSPWVDKNARAEFTKRSKIGVLIHYSDTNEKAKANVTLTKIVSAAQQKVFGLKVEEMEALVEQLGLGNARLMDFDELQDVLIRHVGNEKNARNFSVLGSEKEVAARKVIKQGISAGLIYEAEDESGWFWKNGDQLIVSRFPNMNLMQSMTLYLATPAGADTLNILMNLLEGKEAEVKDTAAVTQ